jgi:hypothetical protein
MQRSEFKLRSSHLSTLTVKFHKIPSQKYIYYTTKKLIFHYTFPTSYIFIYSSHFYKHHTPQWPHFSFHTFHYIFFFLHFFLTPYFSTSKHGFFFKCYWSLVCCKYPEYKIIIMGHEKSFVIRMSQFYWER